MAPQASPGEIRAAPPVLVVGATGYVGGRLIPELLAAGYRVRAAGRSLEKLAARPWACDPRAELAAAGPLSTWCTPCCPARAGLRMSTAARL